ncbi:MAG: glutathione S-transferase [Halioglobus sp.]|jgi:glutathione S-transferase
MLTLHGFAASNYYNAVKHVLLHKGIPFQEDKIFGGGDEWLAVSPVGKVPAITTEDGRTLSESSVICDYLEETYPAVPLYPQDPGERASVRQIMKIAELYLELPCRRLISYQFSGKAAPDALQRDIRQVVTRGIKALQILCKFSPWIAGEQQTMADIYVHYVNAVVGQVGSKQLEWDILAEVPGMKEWRATMKDTDIARTVEADRVENLPEFAAYITAFMEAAKASASKSG